MVPSAAKPHRYYMLVCAAPPLACCTGLLGGKCLTLLKRKREMPDDAAAGGAIGLHETVGIAVHFRKGRFQPCEVVAIWDCPPVAGLVTRDIGWIGQYEIDGLCCKLRQDAHAVAVNDGVAVSGRLCGPAW